MTLEGGEVNVYDFSGQQQYTTTQQLFLSSEVCYELLLATLLTISLIDGSVPPLL